MSTRAQLRRIAIATVASTAMVVLIAALVPRAFLVNDDPGLVVGLRLGTYTPWMSPVLARVLAEAYHAVPDVPWYGLYLYGLIALSGAVLIHTCIELVDRREGYGRVATLLGAGMLIGSHVVLAVGVTWTTVSMSTLGTALVAFVAHLQTCAATGTRASPVRAAIYGLLFVAGFALREAVIAAVAAALLPLLAWLGLRFLRLRHLPRLAALFAFVAPFAIIVVMQGRVPPRVHQEPRAEYAEFNNYRGRIAEAAAFSHLDKRAPELLERSGWTVEQYRDFSNWLLADDSEFTTDMMRRLVETGGVPRGIDVDDVFEVLGGIARDSAPSVWLFLSIVAAALLLAWLDVIDRQRALWFNLGNLVFLAFVPVAMSALSRFPQRVSLSFYTVAAFGAFVVLAGDIAARPPREDSEREERPVIALLAISLCMFVWARGVLQWTHRDEFPYHAPLQAFAQRVTARDGIVLSAPGIAEMDPLLADPLGYDALPSGWGTFTAPWFAYIERFGIHSGSELLHKIVDHPNAYLLGSPYVRDTYAEWLRRRAGNPAIRLAIVDAAEGVPATFRPELYRIVTTPLVHGSDEWNLADRTYRAVTNELPGPPDLRDVVFKPITLNAPYDPVVSSLHRPSRNIVVVPVDGGVRLSTSALGPQCAPDNVGGEGEYVGFHIPVHGLRAARFELALIAPENILGLYAYALTSSSRSVRWRWDFDLPAQQFGFTGTVSLVPGHAAHRMWLVDNSATMREITDLHVIIAVKPGTHAGFELRRLEVAEP